MEGQGYDPPPPAAVAADSFSCRTKPAAVAGMHLGLPVHCCLVSERVSGTMKTGKHRTKLTAVTNTSAGLPVHSAALTQWQWPLISGDASSHCIHLNTERKRWQWPANPFLFSIDLAAVAAQRCSLHLHTE